MYYANFFLLPKIKKGIDIIPFLIDNIIINKTYIGDNYHEKMEMHRLW